MAKKKVFNVGIFLVIMAFVIYFLSTNSFILGFKKTSDVVKVGVAVPTELIEDNSLFFRGLEMAVDEINSEGGILGKPLETVVLDDENKVTKALEIAEKFSLEKDIKTVIGHWSSSCTVPSAQTYELNDIILISPISTASSLTKQNYQNIFRNTTTDEEVGIRLAEYSVNKGYKNIAIYYADSEYGKNFAKAMEERCMDLDINIIDRHSYFFNKQEFESTYKKWSYMNVDAIFIADTITDVRELIYWIREKDIDIPIIGGDGFDIEEFKEYMGYNSENIAYTTFLNNTFENNRYNEFSKKFKDIYNRVPDYWAIKAYDSIYLIKKGMESAGTTENVQEISKMLKTIENIEGINGDYRFDDDGNMVGEKIVIKEVVNGVYEYLFEY